MAPKKQNSGAENRTIRKLKDELEALKKSMPQAAEQKGAVLRTWQKDLMQATGSEYLLNKIAVTPDQVSAILELPVYGVEPAQSVSAINAIRQQQRLGNYYQPAIFADAILQDSVIYANLQTRVKALVGTEMKLEPADESEQAQLICEACEECIDIMMPKTEIEEMLRWGLLLGTSISQIMWDADEGKWLPQLKIMHPKYVFYNWATRLFNITTQGVGSVAKTQAKPGGQDSWIQILPEDIQWDLFTPYTEHLPWMRGLILPLAMLWLMRNWNEQWWSQHQEKNGQGLLVAITSAEATPQEEKLFAAQLAGLMASPVVRAPQGVEGNKFDVRREDPNSDLYMGFKEILDYIDRRIAMVILGQDKTSMAKTSGMSIGGADAGEEVRLDLMRSDAQALSCNLKKNILERYVRFNFGEDAVALTPNICFDVEPEEDIKQIADAQFTGSQAIMNMLQTPLADKINFLEWIEQFKIPCLDEGEAPQAEMVSNKPEADPGVDPKETVLKANSYEELKRILLGLNNG